eukprot:Polyplicarium_translucidae@DN1395_c0_g1_i3.p1
MHRTAERICRPAARTPPSRRSAEFHQRRVGSLEGEFASRKTPVKTRHQLGDLKQSENTGSTALGNDESIFLFTNGLKPELAREIRLREPESLREAQKLARRLETIQQALQGSEPMDLSVARSRPDRGQNESSEDASMLELWRTRTHRKVL